MRRDIICSEATFIFLRHSVTLVGEPGCERAISVRPAMAPMGVRMSCDISDKKVVLASLAISAWSRASRVLL